MGDTPRAIGAQPHSDHRRGVDRRPAPALAGRVRAGKRPGPEWDPDRLRAQGYDDLADHVLRTWCKGWRAPKPRISRKLVARHNAKKAGQKARRDWTF
jgi:hypothetical protein